MFDLRASGFPKGLAHTPAGRQRTPHSVNVEGKDGEYDVKMYIGLTTFSRTRQNWPPKMTMDDMVVVFETPLGAAVLRPRSWCDECRENGRSVLPGTTRAWRPRTAPRGHTWTAEEDKTHFRDEL